MNILTWIAAFLAGLLASLGTGGGMLLIIWLTAVMGTDQLEAQGINLIFFLPLAILSVILHSKNGYISIKKMLPAIWTGVISSALFSIAAHSLGSRAVRKIYALFLLFTGIRSLLGIFKMQSAEKSTHKVDKTRS